MEDISVDMLVFGFWSAFQDDAVNSLSGGCQCCSLGSRFVHLLQQWTALLRVNITLLL